MNVKNKKCKQHPWRPRGNWSVEQGLKNVPSGSPGQLDSPSGNFSLLLAQWARDQASHLPTKALKLQTKTCPGQAKFESYLSQRQAGIQVFFKP